MVASRFIKLAPLLLGSGFCALVDQVVWEREFRLVFGVTTAACAAVIGIFAAGLGLGSAWLGKRADRHPNPLMLYANLELAVGAWVALTPSLLHAVRVAYIALGGSTALGVVPGALVRLLLAALVLGPPTVLMGGTLPAAARAIEHIDDNSRGATGLLYGTNTIGAVLGALASSLLLVEVFGNRVTLWLAALLSALVGMAARALARTVEFRGALPNTAPSEATASIARERGRGSPRLLVGVAGLTGFAFFVMELVAPRVLAPLLGGTVFTFGMMLAVVLAGIGVGGLIYGRRESSPRLQDLAITLALEALAFSLPLWVGDDLAILTLRLRPLQDFGFPGYVSLATLIVGFTLLLPAVISGYQFPLLIGLLGKGREHVGRDVGHAYAANTLGAMAGALLGGLLLLPVVSALGSWRLIVGLLGIAGCLIALCDTPLDKRRWRAWFWACSLSLVAVSVALLANGPTAVWRHSGIGAGRVASGDVATYNARKAWEHQFRRSVFYERDGRESSVALLSGDETVLVVTGKADGSTRGDAGTQVMSGLLGALRHPAPRSALVVGMATGCTAGWLAAVPAMQRVDVVEIEPATLEMARVSAPVNEHALDNPKVHLRIEDAREHMLTTRARYDIVVSEPSNPYRAGVASLYTQEFYASVAGRLGKHGVFVQWIQTYEVDAAALRIAMGTLSSVFSHVELWELSGNDLVAVASLGPLEWDIATLRTRIAEEPYRRAMRVALQTEGLEGLWAHLRARDGLVTALAGPQPVVNTDDHNYLEFSFARTLGKPLGSLMDQITRLSRAQGLDRLAGGDASLDYERIADEVASMGVLEGIAPADPRYGQHLRTRAMAKAAYAAGRSLEAWAAWQRQPNAPRSPVERLLTAEGATEANAPVGAQLRSQLAASHPTEAELLAALAQCRGNDAVLCAEQLRRALDALHQDAWVFLPLATRWLGFAQTKALEHPEASGAVVKALSVPFAARNLEATRLGIYSELAASLGLAECRSAYERMEPHPIWTHSALRARALCYEKTNSPLLPRARADRLDFLTHEPLSLAAESL
jgi:spermidine synthase/MFS family permease